MNAALWLNRAADRRRGLAVAMLSVGSFSVAQVLNILLNIEIPQVDESVAWAADAGLVIGAAVALLGGFVAWLYLSFGIFIIIRIGATDLSAAQVTRRTGIAFVFPLAGLVASVLVGALGAPSLVSNGPYLASGVCGLAVLARALSRATEGRSVLSAIAVATPIVVALAALTALALVGQSFAPVETGS